MLLSCTSGAIPAGRGGGRTGDAAALVQLDQQGGGVGAWMALKADTLERKHAGMCCLGPTPKEDFQWTIAIMSVLPAVN